MRSLVYLDAMCRQGMGDLVGALQLYGSPELALQGGPHSNYEGQNFRILAALNSITILRRRTPRDQARAKSLQSVLESHCLDHAHQAYSAAFSIIKASGFGPNDSIMARKTHLVEGQKVAHGINNVQLQCLLWNIATDVWYHGLVGAMAENSAMAAQKLARQANDNLWLSVANGNLARIKEGGGKFGEAETARKEGQKIWAKLRGSLKRTLSPSSDAAAQRLMPDLSGRDR